MILLVQFGINQHELIFQRLTDAFHKFTSANLSVQLARATLCNYLFILCMKFHFHFLRSILISALFENGSGG